MALFFYAQNREEGRKNKRSLLSACHYTFSKIFPAQ